MKNYTIASTISFKGVGIHTGKPVICRLVPDNKLTVHRLDLDSVWDVHHTSIQLSAIRATRIGDEASGVSTPEHLLAALSLCGVSHCKIEVSGPEFPIMDGSARLFIEEILSVGIVESSGGLNPLIIDTVFEINTGTASLKVAPSDSLSIDYKTAYPNSHIGSQYMRWEASIDTGYDSIGTARTYAFEHEIDALHARGLGLGGSLDNTLVITDTGYINEPHFSNECARHKILDIIGDFMFLACPIQGKISGKSSGHQLNLELVKEIAMHYKSELFGSSKSFNL